MKPSPLLVALSLSLLLPSLALADPEVLHATPPTAVASAPTPGSLIPDQQPIDLLPRRLRQSLLEHAQQRKVIGRSLTFAGIGALVIAFGVGVPLIVAGHNSYTSGGYDMEVAGIALTSIFGALGGSAVTVGPILWQLGASQESRLRHGDFELLGSVRNRRIAGGLLIGVGVVGEIVAMVGGGMVAAGTSLDDESGLATESHMADVGVDLILAGSAVAVLGCTIGGTLLTTAGRDQKLALAMAPGGLRLMF